MNVTPSLPLSLSNASPVVANVFLSTENDSSSAEAYEPSAPQWMVEFIAFRQRLFLRTVEPIIVKILGPVEEDEDWIDTSASGFSNGYEYNNETLHRRLGFLPEYVENASAYRETSMSFATLITLFVSMFCLMVVFLSCFYHNQKTSPLFISPRRHRLPKLVPPPLPIDGYFDWVSGLFRYREIILKGSFEEIEYRRGIFFEFRLFLSNQLHSDNSQIHGIHKILSNKRRSKFVFICRIRKSYNVLVMTL